MFIVNNKATKTTSWRCFGGFIVNFEHISQLCSSVSIVNFEHVTAGWVMHYLRFIIFPKFNFHTSLHFNFFRKPKFLYISIKVSSKHQLFPRKHLKQRKHLQFLVIFSRKIKKAVHPNLIFNNSPVSEMEFQKYFG